jgi:hypothetical protein
MVEFYVENFKQGDEETVFGGKLSVSFPRGMKPLIIIGHNECILKQYCLSEKHSVPPCGMRVLVLKDEGQGVMLNMSKMSKLYGSKQPRMRDTVITSLQNILECFVEQNKIKKTDKSGNVSSTSRKGDCCKWESKGFENIVQK